jgi:hypothetical protein
MAGRVLAERVEFEPLGHPSGAFRLLAPPRAKGKVKSKDAIVSNPVPCGMKKISVDDVFSALHRYWRQAGFRWLRLKHGVA